MSRFYALNWSDAKGSERWISNVASASRWRPIQRHCYLTSWTLWAGMLGIGKEFKNSVFRHPGSEGDTVNHKSNLAHVLKSAEKVAELWDSDDRVLTSVEFTLQLNHLVRHVRNYRGEVIPPADVPPFHGRGYDPQPHYSPPLEGPDDRS